MLRLYLYAISSLMVAHAAAQELGQGYNFDNNGKSDNSTFLKKVYNEVRFVPKKDVNVESISDAIQSNLMFLERLSNTEYKLDGVTFNSADLLKATQLIQKSEELAFDPNQFSFWQIKGEDGLGNVHFTGYFVPIIQVKKIKDEIFKYPLYKRPAGPPSSIPTRNQIDFQGSLEDKALELAYSSDLLDNYFMQVQGSGMIQYPNGKTELLSYGGHNGKRYFSIGSHLVQSGQVSAESISLLTIRKYFQKNPDSLKSILSLNSSYTFFTKSVTQPVGAANVPLVPFAAVAVDSDIIPFGSLLLAKVPMLNEAGKFIKHEFKLLFAHDTGGAIKGPGHIDLYFGIGQEAKQLANAMHHYGELWLLLPKKP